MWNHFFFTFPPRFDFVQKASKTPKKGGVPGIWVIFFFDPWALGSKSPGTPFDPRAHAENFHFFSSLVLIWTRVTSRFFKNFATNPKPRFVHQNFFQNPQKQKIHVHPDEFWPKKVSAHSAIPLWNPKRSTLTIFRLIPSKTPMIIALVIKTHVFHLEYFMVIKRALYHHSA